MIKRQDVAGKRTCAANALILDKWLSRSWGEMTYRTTQLMTAHGCFNTFLYRIKKAPVCTYYNQEEDSTEYYIMFYSKWDTERELKEKIGDDLQLIHCKEDMR